MRFLQGFDDPPAYQGGIVAIGNFDGVHRGHQRMIATLIEEARKIDGPSVVLTFDPPPVQLLRPEAVPPRLTTIAEKARLIESLGVDCMIVYPTNPALLHLEPEEFFEQIIVQEIQAQGMVEGENFCFGRNRRGDVALLQELCHEVDCQLTIVKPETRDDDWISSSRIRRAVSEGDVATAGEMLGRLYQIAGTVAAGESRGRELGFPTANLTEIPTLIPAAGVYAAHCDMDGTQHIAAVHIGPNPTFEVHQSKVEVHLLDWMGDLYGQTLNVEFLGKVRDVVAFESVSALKTQIEIDLAEVRRLANG